MKAESTIRKEMQRLWRRKKFYDERHNHAQGRCWQEDQLYGAAEALRWALGHIERFSRHHSEYDDHKASASESESGEGK